MPQANSSTASGTYVPSSYYFNGPNFGSYADPAMQYNPIYPQQLGLHMPVIDSQNPAQPEVAPPSYNETVADNLEKK